MDIKYQTYRVPSWLTPEVSVCPRDAKKLDCFQADIRHLFQEHLHLHRGSDNVYTDGLKAGNSVGCAAVFGGSELATRLSGRVYLVTWLSLLPTF